MRFQERDLEEEELLEKQAQATRQRQGETDEGTGSRTSSQAAAQMVEKIYAGPTETTIIDREDKEVVECLPIQAVEEAHTPTVAIHNPTMTLSQVR